MHRTIVGQLLPLLILMVGMLAGCSKAKPKSLPTAYGKRTGTAGSSVNGTRALSEMFREAGYPVQSAEQISPRTLRSDIIIWVPSDFQEPSQKMRDTILHWLDEKDGRTFIYIGRDYDASIQYWTEIMDQVAPDKQFDAMRQRSLAIEEFDELRNDMIVGRNDQFFKIETDKPERIATKLSGLWSDGIDGSKTHIQLRSKMDPGLVDGSPSQGNTKKNPADGDDEEEPPVYLVEDVEPLLSSRGETIVARLGSDFSDSQIILINNGSFLLNLPLVNREHRKLAGKLINQCGQTYFDPESVAFLETNGPVRIMSADDATGGNSGWEWLSKWPLNLVGLQMAWWLIVLCFALYPIFGRPKQLPAAENSDFKKHIDSVGDLLQATDDYAYAQLRLEQYQQAMKGDAVYRRSKTKRGDGK
ncbi:hypothetical protein GC197_16890 [bacterium]|nr:hypothetical protein [bacterium]